MAGAHEDVAAVLQQRVHRNHEEAGERADQDHQRDGDGDAPHEDHDDDDDPHRDADRYHVDRAVERYEPGRHHGAGGDSDGADPLQYGRLRQGVAERDRGPLDHDELQRRARAPEQRRRGERYLSQLVAPEQLHAVRKLVDQEQRVLARRAVVHAGVGNIKIEDCRDRVEHHDDQDRSFGRAVDPGFDIREVDCEQSPRNRLADQHAAEQGPEYDRRDRQALDPAVGDDQPVVRQVLGEDAVLGRRISGGAEPDDAVGHEHRDVKGLSRLRQPRGYEHQQAAYDFHQVGDEHHPALGHRVGERADERGEYHVGNGEEELEQRRHPLRRRHLDQHRDRRDQQRVVGERREELRRHDDVEAERHAQSGRPARASEGRAGGGKNRQGAQRGRRAGVVKSRAASGAQCLRHFSSFMRLRHRFIPQIMRNVVEY